MKAVVVYYSLSGNTRQAGRAIARALACEAVEIEEQKDRHGAGGYFRAGLDAMRKRFTPIAPLDRDWKAFDLVVVGTPVWAFTVAPPVRTFLRTHCADIRRIAFFCTMGGSGAARTFRHMQALAGKQPEEVLALTEREVKEGLADKIAPFTGALASPRT